jgi:hypothetical protein
VSEEPKVISMGHIARSPDGGYPEVVANLEAIVAQARRGEIQSFAILMVRPNGNISTQFTPTIEAHKLVAGCEYMKHDMIVAQNKER